MGKELLVPSQFAAEMQTRSWEKLRDVFFVTDGEGHEWRIKIESEPDLSLPKPSRPWYVSLTPELNLSKEDLAKTTGLDPRSVQLCDPSGLRLTLKSIQENLSSEEEARTFLQEQLPLLKSKIEGTPLLEIKKKLLGKQIDLMGKFGPNKEKT